MRPRGMTFHEFHSPWSKSLGALRYRPALLNSVHHVYKMYKSENSMKKPSWLLLQTLPDTWATHVPHEEQRKRKVG